MGLCKKSWNWDELAQSGCFHNCFDILLKLSRFNIILFPSSRLTSRNARNTNCCFSDYWCAVSHISDCWCTVFVFLILYVLFLIFLIVDVVVQLSGGFGFFPEMSKCSLYFWLLMRCFPFATEIGIWATLDYDPTSEQLALTKVHKCTHASYAHMLLSYSYALIAGKRQWQR